MSELIITCCDFCNKEQRVEGGKGYTFRSEEEALSEDFGWIKICEKVVCPECQNRGERR